MLKPTEIEFAISALGNQIEAGIDIARAVKRMGLFQKKYKEQWDLVYEEVNNGKMLSDTENIKKLMPEHIIATLKVAERAGVLAKITKKIEETLVMQQSIKKTFSTLIYPAAIVGFALVVFFFFSGGVIPSLSKSMDIKEGGIFEYGEFMKKVLSDYALVILGVIVGGGIGFVTWFKDPNNKHKFFSLFKFWDLAWDTYLKINYGVFSTNVALFASVGSLDFITILKLSCTTSIKAIQDQVGLMIHDMELQKSPSDAVNPEKLAPDDIRHEMPFYFSNAIMLGSEMASSDVELERAGKAMIKEALKQIDKIKGTLMIISITFATVTMMSTIGMYFMHFGSALQKAFVK